MYGGSLDGLRPFIFIHTNSKIMFAGLFIKRRRTKKQNSTQKWQEKNSYQNMCSRFVILFMHFAITLQFHILKYNKIILLCLVMHRLHS